MMIEYGGRFKLDTECGCRVVLVARDCGLKILVSLLRVGRPRRDEAALDTSDLILLEYAPHDLGCCASDEGQSSVAQALVGNNIPETTQCHTKKFSRVGREWGGGKRGQAFLEGGHNAIEYRSIEHHHLGHFALFSRGFGGVLQRGPRLVPLWNAFSRHGNHDMDEGEPRVHFLTDGTNRRSGTWRVAAGRSRMSLQASGLEANEDESASGCEAIENEPASGCKGTNEGDRG